MFNQMHKIEKMAYPLIALYVLVGMAIALVSPEYFSKVFAKEDGPVEWLTVLALILSFVMCVQLSLIHISEPTRPY